MSNFERLQPACICLAFLALAACAAAQDTTVDTRTISVAGQGEAAGPPDQATVNAGVRILAPTVIEASAENQAIVERIMAALEEHSVPAKDIQTTDYSIRPEQRYDPQGSREATVTGFWVSNTVRITIRDVDRIGELLAAVTGAGANTIYGVAFGVSDPAALEARAREAAMNEARPRAEALAELADVELGDVVSISMTPGGGPPVPMMAGRNLMAESAAVPSIAAGELSIRVQVYVTYAIR